MLSYYKFNDSYFKLDAEKTFFQQINNLPNEKTVVYGGTSGIIEALHAAQVRDNWEVITEEQYNTIKTSVITFLSAN